jgi:archaemetzincin
VSPEEAIEIVPLLGLEVAAAEALAARLSQKLRARCRVSRHRPVGEHRPLPGRNQEDADALLVELEAAAPPSGTVLVGVTSRDVAIPIFTFVFGRARQNGRAAVVSLARLDPTFYGLPPDPEHAARRAVAEVLHELGHVAGLAHCPNGTCLMSFAGNVDRADARGHAFCSSCLPAVPPWLQPW